METYLFKFSACLVVFWLVYILFLERQTMHRFKRFYLLVAIASSLVIPTITITEYVEPTPSSFEVSTLYIPFQPSLIEQPQVQVPFFDLETMLWMLYGLGVLVFAVRFVVNLYKMYKRISAHEQIEKRPFIFVLLEECRIPHSFFKYLFFERSKYETDAIPDEVKLHEETHAEQLHSLDIMTIELLQIVFWFHPLIYILKHHIKLNHEFLADQAVLDEGIDTKAYQKLLLQFSSNTKEYQLSSAINYSSIKKRFTVMKTQTSKTRMWLSGLLLLPIIAILFYSFTEKEYVEKDNSEINKNELIKAESLQIQYIEEAPEKLMQEYRDFIENFERTKTIRSNTYERAYTIYNDLMSDEQRRSVKPLPKLPNIDLTDTNPISPTKSEFDSWKNASEYALWLDGSPIPNSKLNTLSPKDIKYFTGSFVHLNARSAKYPQPYQYQLYTEKGFKSTYQESNIKKHSALTNEYINALNNYLQRQEIKHSELQILKARIDKLYNSFTEQELKHYSILPAPPVPAVQKTPKTILSILIKDNGDLIINNKPGDLSTLKTFLQNLDIPKEYTISFKTEDQVSQTDTEKVLQLLKTYKVLFDSNPIELSTQQEKASAKQVADYNAWAKKLNTAMTKAEANNDVNAYPIVKVKEVNKYKAIYDIMTANQKRVSQPWPSFPPPPQPTPPAPKRPTVIEIAEYNVWAKKLNTTMAEAEESNDYANIIVKQNEVKKYKAVYHSMTANQKKVSRPWPNIPPPPPPVPEVPKPPKNKKSEKIITPFRPVPVQSESIQIFKKKDSSKNKPRRRIYISISESGDYGIVKNDYDSTRFEPTTLYAIEKLLSQLTSKELKNTFIFSSYEDLKKYRGKPSSTPEYQDDVEIWLVKAELKNGKLAKDISFEKSKNMFQLIYHNGIGNLQPHLDKLIKVFKAYETINMTLR